MQTVSSTSKSDVCHREGCSSTVANGIQCDQCQGWYHFKCTSLKRTQYEQLIGSQRPFICFSCIFSSSSNTTTRSTSTSTSLDNPVEARQVDESNEQIADLRLQVTEVSRSLSSVHSKVAQLTEELHVLNEDVASLLPDQTVAKEAIRQSKEVVLESAQLIADREIRRQRVIVWEHFVRIFPHQSCAIIFWRKP